MPSIVTGMSVMIMSGLAAAAGLPQFQMGDVLVVVYAILFLGLLFRAVMVVATALTGGVRRHRLVSRRVRRIS